MDFYYFKLKALVAKYLSLKGPMPEYFITSIIIEMFIL